MSDDYVIRFAATLHVDVILPGASLPRLVAVPITGDNGAYVQRHLDGLLVRDDRILPLAVSHYSHFAGRQLQDHLLPMVGRSFAATAPSIVEALRG